MSGAQRFVTSQLLASGVEFRNLTILTHHVRHLSRLATLAGRHDLRLGVATFRRFNASAISRSVLPRLRTLSAGGYARLKDSRTRSLRARCELR
jgi:hypothetical protein